MKIGDIARISGVPGPSGTRLEGALVQIIDISRNGTCTWKVQLCEGYGDRWSLNEFYLQPECLIVQEPPLTEQLDDVRASLHQMRDELHDDV